MAWRDRGKGQEGAGPLPASGCGDAGADGRFDDFGSVLRAFATATAARGDALAAARRRHVPRQRILLCLASDKSAWFADARVTKACANATTPRIETVLDGGELLAFLDALCTAQTAAATAEARTRRPSRCCCSSTLTRPSPSPDRSWSASSPPPFLGSPVPQKAGKSPDNLTFVDVMSEAGTTWGRPSNGAHDYGEVRGFAADADASASGTLVSAVLPRSLAIADGRNHLDVRAVSRDGSAPAPR